MNMKKRSYRLKRLTHINPMQCMNSVWILIKTNQLKNKKRQSRKSEH